MLSFNGFDIKNVSNIEYDIEGVDSRGPINTDPMIGSTVVLLIADLSSLHDSLNVCPIERKDSKVVYLKSFCFLFNFVFILIFKSLLKIGFYL